MGSILNSVSEVTGQHSVMCLMASAFLGVAISTSAPGLNCSKMFIFIVRFK